MNAPFSGYNVIFFPFVCEEEQLGHLLVCCKDVKKLSCFCVLVCGCVLELMKPSSSQVEQSDWQTQTCLLCCLLFLVKFSMAANFAAFIKH